VGPNGPRRGHGQVSQSHSGEVTAAGFPGMIRRSPGHPGTVHNPGEQGAGQALAGNGTVRYRPCADASARTGYPQKTAIGSRWIGDRPVPRADIAFHLDRSRACPGTHCWHQRRTRAMPDPGSPGIWSVFQPAADVGGIAGPVPAQTCGQATVTSTWMPGRRARRPGGLLEPRRPAVLPGPQAEPTKPLVGPPGADPAADSTVQRGPCPPGLAAAATAGDVDVHYLKEGCRMQERFFSPGMDIGVGVNLLTGEALGVAFEPLSLIVWAMRS
jgi:hypothetical protein